MARKKKYPDPVPDKPRNITPYVNKINEMIKYADELYHKQYRNAEAFKYGILLAHNELIKDTDYTPLDVADIELNLKPTFDENVINEGRDYFNKNINN